MATPTTSMSGWVAIASLMTRRTQAASSTTRIRAIDRLCPASRLYVVVRAADGSHADTPAFARVEPHAATLRAAQVAPCNEHAGLSQDLADRLGIRIANARACPSWVHDQHLCATGQAGHQSARVSCCTRGAHQCHQCW